MALNFSIAEDELMRQLQQARDARLASEKKREELVKKARAMQARTNNRRNQGWSIDTYS